MSNANLLLDVIKNMRSLADSLQALADAMPEKEPKAEKATAVAEVKAPTLEEVRAVLAEKSRKGHTADIKALLIKHGADKLSDISTAEYQSLLADVEVL
ncbi:hypothetical protein SDC9_148377 [bioreactor metagenome]|uniref:rRNA biogenesis protein rrp5 n=1 Tax=bioreactor metagenome TaxID=1076179 RepID=A0A645EGX4_9ZZZZ|nr:rRNA biogenesis protein rrp5 [Candidatus Metalachnospira sp.]